jgi:hypothetical protein
LAGHESVEEGVEGEFEISVVTAIIGELREESRTKRGRGRREGEEEKGRERKKKERWK